MKKSNASIQPSSHKAYEATDVHSSPIVNFTVGLIILVAVVSVMLYAFLGIMENRAREADQSPFFAQATQSLIPPAIQLEVHPSQELDKYKKEMANLTGSHDWVDKEKKIARIPIEEAMTLTLKKGFPVRSENKGASA